MSAQKDSQHKKTLENSCDRPNQSSCYAIKHDGQFSLYSETRNQEHSPQMVTQTSQESPCPLSTREAEVKWMAMSAAFSRA